MIYSSVHSCGKPDDAPIVDDDDDASTVLHPWITCYILVDLLISPFICFIMDF
jgi:hypothetical protein